MREESVTISGFQNWSVVLLSLENLNIVQFFTEYGSCCILMIWKLITNVEQVSF